MDNFELEISRMIVDVLDLEDVAPESIDPDAPLFVEGLGLDSIDALEIGVALRKRYGVRLEASDSANREHFRCVRSLAALVRARRMA